MAKRRNRAPVNTEPERERVLIVGVYNYGEQYMQENLDEFAQLCEAANLNVVHQHLQKINKPQSKYFIGKGRAESLNNIVKEKDVDTVLFDCQLSPRQENNLEELFMRTVLDRTALILDIFARNAKTKQSTIQVELAQLQYHRTRLTKLWTHLDRYKGGGVGTRGPGEQQLEVDKRLVDKRIGMLKRQANEIMDRTVLQNQSRNASFKVSLVGYTNAGKSSLLNRLTGAEVFVKNQLFATLDTRTRHLQPKPDEIMGGDVLMSDTVGFIRRLPHSLVDSFHATLEESIQADLLLHVVDANDPALEAHVKSVKTVLNEIGAGDNPTIMVFNKTDCVEDREILDQRIGRYHNTVCVSAKTGSGCDSLLDMVRERAVSFFNDLSDKGEI